MGAIQKLAEELNADERTLRRAVTQNTIRCRRPGPRRIRLAPGESQYLRGHWQLLANLRQALRTQRGIRLAVLYGSVARGDEDAGSDLDLLVDLADDTSLTPFRLATHLGGAAGREVDIAHLDRVQKNAPLLLARVLDEGRVIVDRDGIWQDLYERRRAIRARGQRSYRRQVDEAAHAIAELTA
ncbi:MAG: nucleotidyltransferase domain-containing protein [Solirubrobacterales bacterium]